MSKTKEPNRDGVDSRHIREHEKGKLLYDSGVEYADDALNHVARCLHGCLYCYAFAGERCHGRVRTRDEWTTDIGLVANAAARIGGELDRKRNPVKRIHLCFTSDPFMWDADHEQMVPEVAEATIEVIKAINARNIPVTVLTKGQYPDLDLGSLHPDNQYGITVASLEEGFRREWEPGAPPVELRIEGLRRLADQGARTWVSVEPYPTPNLDPGAGNPIPLLEELAFIDKFIFGQLNYVSEATKYLKADPDFYLRVALKVQSWCEAHGKLLHIKSSTPLHRPETMNILDVALQRDEIDEDAA